MARPRKIEVKDVRTRTLQAFWKDGYHEASLSTLEQATGLGRRSLLNTFGDKRRMFIEALKDFRAVAANRFLEPMERDGAGLDGIRETLNRLADEAATEDGRLGCLICNTAREPIARDPDVNQQIWLYFGRIEAAFANALAHAQAAGDVALDRDIASLAQALLATLVSLCTLARAGAPREMIDNIVAEALARLR